MLICFLEQIFLCMVIFMGCFPVSFAEDDLGNLKKPPVAFQLYCGSYGLLGSDDALSVK